MGLSEQIWIVGDRMHFKLAGLLFLIVGAYLAINSLVLAEGQHSSALTAQVDPLVAIFLVMTVRVLQAEKHHRERQRATDNAEKEARSMHEQEAVSRI
jgi:hypothetical protein